MKRCLLSCLLAFTLLSLTMPALAAPLSQGPKPVITQPEPDAAVRGVVQVVGSATDPQFQRYELYYAPFPVPSDNSWIFIGDAHFQQQPAGLLGTWATGGLPDGAYALKVRVVRADGNYQDSDPRRVLVANRRPVETPTPEVTAALEPTPVPTALPATPTIIIAVPTVQLPGTTVTATIQARMTPTPIIAADSGQSGGSSLGGLVDVGRLIEAAKTAATYTAGLFAVVGAFFAVKAALAWLWHKVRP